MYALNDFEPYTNCRHLDSEPVLAWSLKDGYHFLTAHQRFNAMRDKVKFKIVGILK